MLGLLPKLDQDNAIEPSESGLTTFLNAPRRSRLTDILKQASLTPFEITARSQGNKVFSQWLDGVSLYGAIHQMQADAPAVDLLEVSLVTGCSRLGAGNWREALGADRNGRNGLEASLHGSVFRVSPLATIASNRPLIRWFLLLIEEKRLTEEGFFKAGGELRLLECRQFLLHCGKPAKAIETYRGNRIIGPELSAETLADDIIAGISRWFMANQDSAGALPYKYWPSSGAYSTADNPIRRFMASVAFNRLAEHLDRSDMKVAARRNLEFNLGRFYRAEGRIGLIAWDEKVKLGALAMAGLAIIESPSAEKWKDELAHLRNAIDSLWQPSGAFRTFIHPADRNDNQNFYPGEALLFWAMSLRQKGDEALLARALKSFDYYRRHFRKSRNPAFVPWHAQAAAILHKLTGKAELRDFIFEMNDWLLAHQQWGEPLPKDCWGRFFTPEKPSFGPPHASATGVYLEGLVDAWALAKELGETQREAAYEQAIGRGIRSIAQLQYRDEIDAYYICRRERVMGAIRTEADNNEIRIDNLQHGLMALLKFQKLNLGANLRDGLRPQRQRAS
jgi:hypothetical protein